MSTWRLTAEPGRQMAWSLLVAPVAAEYTEEPPATVTGEFRGGPWGEGLAPAVTSALVPRSYTTWHQHSARQGSGPRLPIL